MGDMNKKGYSKLDHRSFRKKRYMMSEGILIKLKI